MTSNKSKIKKPARGLKAGSARPPGPAGPKSPGAKGHSPDRKKKWLEVAPYGIIEGMIPEASAMLFRDQKGRRQFMVWLSELQSRMAADQIGNREQPFGFVQKILKAGGSLPESCFFIKTEEGRDIVTLTFQGGALKPLQFYADEVISFCMLSKCRFFCAGDFLENASRGEIPKRFMSGASEKRPMYLN